MLCKSRYFCFLFFFLLLLTSFSIAAEAESTGEYVTLLKDKLYRDIQPSMTKEEVKATEVMPLWQETKTALLFRQNGIDFFRDRIIGDRLINYYFSPQGKLQGFDFSIDFGENKWTRDHLYDAMEEVLDDYDVTYPTRHTVVFQMNQMTTVKLNKKTDTQGMYTFELQCRFHKKRS